MSCHSRTQHKSTSSNYRGWPGSYSAETRVSCQIPRINSFHAPKSADPTVGAGGNQHAKMVGVVLQHLLKFRWSEFQAPRCLNCGGAAPRVTAPAKAKQLTRSAGSPVRAA